MKDIKSEKIVLENEKVKLVPLTTEHTADFISFAKAEPFIWKYSIVNPGGNAMAMENYIAFALKERDENKSCPFAVIDKQGNQIAGCTRFYDIDFNHKVATIGYTWYGKNFQRTGLNRNCKLLMLEYAFETWNVERVEFRADINNNVSIQAMKNIGCVEEGILRSHATIENGRRTSMVLSILKDEWFGGVKEKLVRKIY